MIFERKQCEAVEQQKNKLAIELRVTQIPQEAKPSIDWGQEFRYSLASIAIFLLLMPIAMEADMFPIDSFRQLVRLLYAFVVMLNSLIL